MTENFYGIIYSLLIPRNILALLPLAGSLQVRVFPIFILSAFSLAPAALFSAAHIPLRNDGNVGEFYVALGLGVFAVDHVESIELQENDESVFAGEENVHVRYYLEVSDEQQAEH